MFLLAHPVYCRADVVVMQLRDVETSVWTAEEIEAYQQAMMKYDKDFFLVSKQVNKCLMFSFSVLLLLLSITTAACQQCT